MAFLTVRFTRLVGNKSTNRELINDDSTPVGSVHLGVVHLLDLDLPAVRPRETAVANAGFAPLAELLRHGGEFESWSRLAMEALASGDAG